MGNSSSRSFENKFQAILDGKESIQEIPRKYINYRFPNKSYLTPLIILLKNNEPKLITEFLNTYQKYIKIDTHSKAGCTALHAAVSYSTPDILEHLLNLHPYIDMGNTERETALMYTSLDLIHGKEKALLLIQAGANPKRKDRGGRTALHHAIQRGNLELVKYLIHIGLNINSQDINGNTPLMYTYYAVNKTHKPDVIIEIIKILLEVGANVYEVNDNNLTIFDFFDSDYHSNDDNSDDEDKDDYNRIMTILLQYTESLYAKKNLDYDYCCICTENLLTNKYFLKCGHAYHLGCIKRWLKIRKICPFRCPIR